MSATYVSWRGAVCALVICGCTLLFCAVQAAPSSQEPELRVSRALSLQQQQQLQPPQQQEQQTFLTADTLAAKLAQIQRQFLELKAQISANSIYNNNNNMNNNENNKDEAQAQVLGPPGWPLRGLQVGPVADRQQTLRQLSWQPMKRSLQDYSRENVIRAIERQLADILQAGERLGIGADDILQHLRRRNAQPIF